MFLPKDFEFTRAAPEHCDVVIGESTKTRAALFDLLARRLSFPDYFGHNWDALIDCLSDFFWWTGTEVVMDHEVLPPLPDDELLHYLHCLIAVDERQQDGRLPRVRFVFREQDRSAIEALLGMN